MGFPHVKALIIVRNRKLNDRKWIENIKKYKDLSVVNNESDIKRNGNVDKQ